MRMFLYLSLLVLLGSNLCDEATELSLVNKSLESLTRALQYMEDTVSDINLDAVFCIRRLEEQIELLLKYEPHVFRGLRRKLEDLQIKAGRIADKGLDFVNKKYHTYSSKLGFLMRKSPKLLWYPSRNISRSLIEEPVACKDALLNFTNSDNCFKEINGPRNGADNSCSISIRCLQDETKIKQRDYTLTHQVLFWELMEQWQCVDIVPETFRDKLCSNVMRDAEMTKRAHFPRAHHDLFLEQIGLCGVWGYKDFNKPEWLEKIIEWQEPSGCFASSQKYQCFDEPEMADHIRVKREERMLSDGCFSHETGVALLALLVNVRFEAEKEYELNRKWNNSMFFMK